MLNLTSEPSSSEDCFETKLQANLDKSNQIFKQPEEYLVNFMEQQHQESKNIEEELVPLNS